MTIKKPEFKAEIKESIEVHLKGSNLYHNARSIEEANEIAKQLEKAAEEKWEREHSKKIMQENLNNFRERNFMLLVEYLDKQLWHDFRDKSINKEYLGFKKEIRSTIQGILNGELKLAWDIGYNNLDIEKTNNNEKEWMGVKQ